MSLLRNMKLMSRDKTFLSSIKSVDLTGVLSCRATFFECFRHNQSLQEGQHEYKQSLKILKGSVVPRDLKKYELFSQET